MLSGLKLLNPLGIDSTLQSIRRTGYLALECFSAAAWPSIIEEANFTLRTNKMASVITTLKVGAAADDIRQNEFLARFSLILKFTPFSINLPACRPLLFPLLHAEKGRLRNAVANRVPASHWVPKILGTYCDRLTHSAHCSTYR